MHIDIDGKITGMQDGHSLAMIAKNVHIVAHLWKTGC